MRLVADMELDVVARRLDPVDFVGADEEHAAAGLDDEALQPVGGRLEILDELQKPALQIAARSAVHLLTGARDRLPETFAVEGLQQIVQRMDIERAQRVLVVGRHEDDQRHARGADGFDDVEAGRAGHLHVQEHEVRLQPADRLDRLGAVLALGDDLEPVLRRKQRTQPLARERLIIGDYNACSRLVHATREAAPSLPDGAWVKGNSMRTARPSDPSENSRVCSSP